jgi:hypothetical protein
MTWMRSAAALPLLLVLLSGCTASPPDPTGSPSASAAPVESTPPATGAPAPSVSAPDRPVTTGIDTSTWIPYTSERYGLRIAHPPDWTVVPAERTWDYEEDVGVIDGPGLEGFMSAEGDIWLTLWAAPFDGPSTLAGIQTWTERYCSMSGDSNCATIGERAVRLCNGRQDCDPGLLVPFETDVQAFFTDEADGGRIIALASWRPPDYRVAEDSISGTSREILDAFLSTMDVWPQP